VSTPAIPATRYVSHYSGARPPAYLRSPQHLQAPAREFKRVLIIDDDPFFRSILKVMLAQTSLPIAEIFEAEEARTALSLCREKAVDLVFCDLNLPAMAGANGIDIVHGIREIDASVPVFMVTAENSESVIEKVVSAGATGHILKPVNLRVLRRTLIAAFCAEADAPFMYAVDTGTTH
jgi:DNA-binding NarL/FixJ family response regulator